MKIVVKILLIISLGVNIYFIWFFNKIRNYEIESEVMDRAFGSKINATNWSEGFKIFITKLKEKDSSSISKKYYYVNIWTSWCGPCIKEMPWLDSIAGDLDKNVGYVFVSDIDEERANKCTKNYNIKNFLFLNNMNDFISGVRNKLQITNTAYPITLVLNDKGEIFSHSIGAYENPKEASEFRYLIKGLP